MLAAALLLAGCGATSAPVATAPLAEGASLTPRQFLADSAAAADAVRDFAAVLDDIGPVAVPSRLTAAADRLADPAARARLMSRRLAAGRLADRRLESERARVAPALDVVVDAMDELLGRISAGDGPGAATASRRFSTALSALAAVSNAESR